MASTTSRAPLLLRPRRTSLALAARVASPPPTAVPATPAARTAVPEASHSLRNPYAHHQRRCYTAAAGRDGKPAEHDPDKPILLEQPTKFVPPSHPSRRGGWSMPKSYGPKWTEAERAESNTRWYPGLMAPAGSWEHWFWHSRAVHTCITVGTLISLAISTFIINFKTNSPFRHQLPENSLFWEHPIEFITAWRRAIRLHNQDHNRKIVEMRMRQADDGLKRRQYMRAHGMDPDGGLLAKNADADDGGAARERERAVEVGERSAGMPVSKVGERLARG